MDNYDNDLSHGFSAGSYCNAYENRDFEKACDLMQASGNRSTAWIHAFILGFFSSYELHEIPEKHLEAFIAAWRSEDGRRVVGLGYCDHKVGEL